MTNAPFGRVLTAMATAFHDDGSVDLDGTAAIARHLVDHGHDGVVVSGTTGESPTTTVPEDGEILAAVVDAVGDRATVVAGVGTNSTAHSLELALQAEKIGADGLLLVTPYYNKPGQAGVLHHFRTVAEATGVPVMLYDVPGPHRHHDRPGDLRRRQGDRDRRGGQGRGRRLRPRRQAHRDGLRRLLRRRRRQPGLARARRRRLRLGRRPRRRRRDPRDGGRVRRPATTPRRSRSSPGCCRPSTP